MSQLPRPPVYPYQPGMGHNLLEDIGSMTSAMPGAPVKPKPPINPQVSPAPLPYMSGGSPATNPATPQPAAVQPAATPRPITAYGQQDQQGFAPAPQSAAPVTLRPPSPLPMQGSGMAASANPLPVTPAAPPARPANAYNEAFTAAVTPMAQQAQQGMDSAAQARALKPPLPPGQELAQRGMANSSPEALPAWQQFAGEQGVKLDATKLDPQTRGLLPPMQQDYSGFTKNASGSSTTGWPAAQSVVGDPARGTGSGQAGGPPMQGQDANRLAMAADRNAQPDALGAIQNATMPKPPLAPQLAPGQNAGESSQDFNARRAAIQRTQESPDFVKAQNQLVQEGQQKQAFNTQQGIQQSDAAGRSAVAQGQGAASQANARMTDKTDPNLRAAGQIAFANAHSRNYQQIAESQATQRAAQGATNAMKQIEANATKLFPGNDNAEARQRHLDSDPEYQRMQIRRQNAMSQQDQEAGIGGNPASQSSPEIGVTATKTWSIAGGKNSSLDKPIEVPPNATPDTLVDGQVYNTSKGVAKWNKAAGRFL